MRVILSFSTALLAMFASAVANDTMDAMIGQSVTYSYDDGTSVTAYYADDGTYTTDTLGGGAWSMNGDELCIETDGGDSGCTTLEPGHGPGDSWESIDAFGTPVTITIG